MGAVGTVEQVALAVDSAQQVGKLWLINILELTDN